MKNQTDELSINNIIQTNGKKIKNNHVKTPYPLNVIKSPDSLLELNLTTKDNSYISRNSEISGISEKERNRSNKFQLYKEFSDVKQFSKYHYLQNFPKFAFISDYFINFKRLKEEKNCDNPVNNSEFLINQYYDSFTPSFFHKINDNMDLKSINGDSLPVTVQVPESVSVPIHYLLPSSLKNDEIYKQLLVNILKEGKLNTDTHKFVMSRKRKCKLFFYINILI